MSSVAELESIERSRISRCTRISPAIIEVNMRAEQAVRAMLKALREVGAPHMVVGGYAANRYRITRLTKDIDFLVDMTDEDLRRLLARIIHRGERRGRRGVSFTNR